MHRAFDPVIGAHPGKVGVETVDEFWHTKRCSA